MPNPPLNLGLIGAGRIGLLHAEHLCHLPEANLLMVADVNEAAARTCAQRFKIPTSTSDYRRVIEHPDLKRW